MVLVGTPSCEGALACVPGAPEALVMLLVPCHILSEAPLPTLAAVHDLSSLSADFALPPEGSLDPHTAGPACQRANGPRATSQLAFKSS